MEKTQLEMLNELFSIWGQKMKSQDHRKELILEKFTLSKKPSSIGEKLTTNSGIIPEHFAG